MSTGGNDGLISALYGYETIRAGIQTYGLVGAGDELSQLSSQLDRALGLDGIPYETGEGSAFLVLMDLERAKREGKAVYAELKSFGTAFDGTRPGEAGDGMLRAAEMALSRSGVEASAIDFLMVHGIHGTVQPTASVETLDPLFAGRDVPVICLNDRLGYCESAGSLYHLIAAVDVLRANRLSLVGAHEAASASSFGSSGPRENCGLVIGASLNGNYTAVVVASGE